MALLTPLLLWQVVQRLVVVQRFAGPALVGLALAYGLAGLALERRRLGPGGVAATAGWGRLSCPVAAIGSFGLPFFVVSCGLSALGLVLAVNQGAAITLLGMILGALHYGLSAFAFRQSLFAYPLAGAGAAAYLALLALTSLAAPYQGLALLPGVAVFLAVAVACWRRLDERTEQVSRRADGLAGRARFGLDSWATPFAVVAHLGAAAMPVWSFGGWWLWAAVWGAGAAVYGTSARVWRRPAWLYPAAGAAIMAYLSLAYALVPGLTFPAAMAALALPVWLFAALAYAMLRSSPAPPVPLSSASSSRPPRPLRSLAHWPSSPRSRRR